MQIKTDFRTIRGEHNGVPFELEDGILKVNGYTFSKEGIKLLVEISNLLALEGFQLVDKLPTPNRKNTFRGATVDHVLFDDFNPEEI